ncbi:MAG: TIR domain-containing protein [Candidatus Korobacteraceae bacterium]
MQLFISYAHEDTPVVRELVDVLVAGGHFVWFDDHILPGQDWKSELDKKISSSEAFVYALTCLSADSEWCQWEFGTAARLQKTILPVLLESAVPIPPALKTLQYADLTKGVTAIAVAKLMGALGSFQRVSTAEAASAPVQPQGVPSRAWENAKHWTDKMVVARHEPQNEAENVLGKFVVSIRRGLESVGGRIVITNQRLLFEAHGINIQREPVSIPLNDITAVGTYNSLGLIPNGFSVQCRSGQEYRFIAYSRKQIIDLINQQKRPG